jgi:hypothetical protein
MADQVLVKKLARKLLLDWANLPNPPDGDNLKWIRLRHPDVFSFIANDDEGLKRLVERVGYCLRQAWKDSDPLRRDWFLFTARQEYMYGMLGTLPAVTRDGRRGWDVARKLILGVPPRTAFDVAVFYAQSRLAHKMRYCQNKDCNTRYFLQRKKNQKYCSVKCTEPTLLRSKRDWWNAHRGKGASPKDHNENQSI